MIEGTCVVSPASARRPDARVQGRRQQMIDHVEALLAAGIVHRRDVGEADEAAAGIVAQEAHDIDDLLGLHRHRELVERDRMTGRRARKRANNRLPQGVEPAVVHCKSLQRSMVPVRRIFFCSSSTP